MVERREETPSGPSAGESVETKLRRIASKARNEPNFQFTSLFHLMDMDLLRGCFVRLRGDAAAGIDRVTKRMYAENLEANLAKLVERLHLRFGFEETKPLGMAYIPQEVRRVYIAKPGSAKLRPLGIPCLEDKLVQSGLVPGRFRYLAADVIILTAFDHLALNICRFSGMYLCAKAAPFAL